MNIRVTKQKRINRNKNQNKLFGLHYQALERSDNGTAILDKDGRILWVNQKLEMVSGYSKEELIGEHVSLFKSDKINPGYYRAIWDQIATGITWRGEMIKRSKDGKETLQDVTISPLEDERGIADHFLISWQNISIIQQRQREMETLLCIAAAIRSTRSRAEIISVLIDEIGKLLDADGISVALVNPVSGIITFEQSSLFMSPSQGITLKPGEGTTSTILRTRLPYRTQDVKSDPNMLFTDVAPPNMAQLGIPLIAQDQAIGVIWMCKKYSIDDADIRVLTGIADIAANAIHRAMLDEQTVLHLERISSLREIDRAINSSLDLRTTLNVVIDQTVSHLKVDAAAIMLYDPSQHFLRYHNTYGFHYSISNTPDLKIGEGFTGRTLITRQSIFFTDIHGDESAGQQALIDREGFISLCVSPLIAKGEVKGVLQVFHRKVLNPDQGWMDFFEALAGQAAIAIHNAELFNNISRTNMDLLAAYEESIEGWSRALEMRDLETIGHSRRVTQMTMRLAEEVGFPREEMTLLRQGVLLHDVGKMGIPDSVLIKPGPLNEEEWELMRRHPEYARDFLISIPHLRDTALVPYTHHERWNGSGYPQKLKGKEIPFASRIFMVVDVWDALSHARPYKKAWTQTNVLKYILDNAGILFDPMIVSIFLDLHKRGEFSNLGVFPEDSQTGTTDELRPPQKDIPIYPRVI